MTVIKSYGDPSLYTHYYKQQAGYGLPGFSGLPVQYGAGIGGIFRALFRKAVPFLKRGFEIAKPHMASAAKNIAKDVVGNVTSAVMSKVAAHQQEGSGLAYIRRGVKRKRQTSSSHRRGPPKPDKRTAKRRQATHRSFRSTKKSVTHRNQRDTKRDIF